MKAHLDQVDHNYSIFSDSWRAQLNKVQAALKNDAQFKESYRRLVSLQAWRKFVIEDSVSTESFGFYLEAQNDALVSHTVASLGSWRLALKSLRSCVENVMLCLYYKDHPVELRLWQNGEHKVGFTELLSYFQKHPDITAFRIKTNVMQMLKKEYSTLSQAVHGSAKSFRMTDDIGDMLLWSSEQKRLGSWITREIHVFTGINLLLLAMFGSRLQGAALIPLRKAISPSIPRSMHKQLKENHKISLFDMSKIS